MKLTAHGRAGHGSMMNDNNAVTAIASAVEKIGNHTWPQRYTKTVKIFFEHLLCMHPLNTVAMPMRAGFTGETSSLCRLHVFLLSSVCCLVFAILTKR